MRTLYFECTSGISGDMSVAALVDAGANKTELLRVLNTLDLSGYDVAISKVAKMNIMASMFEVHLHEHHHHDDGKHEEHHHEHVHRTISDITPIIESADMSPAAKSIAKAIFAVLAEAEGAVHGLKPEEVHFHEVGAVDSIIDIIAVAFCVDDLHVGKVLCSPLRDGRGQVKTQHGIMPIPVPATVELLSRASLPLIITDTEGEMITPTGAAIVSALADSATSPKMDKIISIGVGAGKKDFEHANILRCYVYDSSEVSSESVSVITTNLDDMTGEHMGYLMDMLLNRGALDVCYSPILMKKNRPAYQLQVMCEDKVKSDLIKTILKHSSALGVRVASVGREICQRKSAAVATVYGNIAIKIAVYDDIEKMSIEFESAKEAALKHNVTIEEVTKAAYAAAKV